MERGRIDSARVLAWVRESEHGLQHVLPAILDERDVLTSQLQDATRRYQAVQTENDGLRAELARVTAGHRQLEREHADIVDSVGRLLAQLTHALEPMHALSEKLGQPRHRRDGAGRAG